VTGKTKRKFIRASTKKALKDKVKDFEDRLERGEDVTGDSMTAITWMETWFSRNLLRLKPYTAQGYRNKLDLFEPYFSKIKLRDLRQNHVQVFIDEEAKRVTVRGKRTATASLRGYVQVISAAMNYAIQNQKILLNPAKGIKFPPSDAEERVAYTGEQLNILFAAVKGGKWDAVAHIGALGGLRRGEVLALTPEDVDFGTGRTRIDKALCYVDKDPKTGEKVDRMTIESVKGKQKERFIILPPQAIASIKRQLDWNTKNRRKRGAIGTQQVAMDMRVGHEGTNWAGRQICLTEAGETMKPQTLTTNFTSVTKSLNIPDSCFHGTRHTCGTLLSESGASPKEIQDQLGHATIAITMNRYVHATDEGKQRNADRLNAQLSRESAEK
jgi:integrase